MKTTIITIMLLSSLVCLGTCLLSWNKLSHKGQSNSIPMPNGWSNCGESSDLFQLESFIITPDPPRRASKLSLRIKGNLLKDITGGQVNYTVHFGVIPIVQDSVDLCEILQTEPSLPQCPFDKGDWDVKHEAVMPQTLPFGRYHITATGNTKDGKRIFCVRGSTMIGLLAETNHGIADDNKEQEWERQVSITASNDF